MTFESLGLEPNLLRALSAEGYTTPTPIQMQALPPALAGQDLLGYAPTGTGKTAAFALPTIQLLTSEKTQHREIRCLVLTPTRELAAQVGESFVRYSRFTDLRCAVIFGGVGQDKQVQQLRRGVDVLVATPGRLMDLLKQRLVSFPSVRVLVLDEADRMLDMGFLPDVRRIIAAVPKQRQTMMFSATMPSDIQKLAESILVRPAKVEVRPVATTAERVEQRLYFVERGDKKSLLLDVLQDPAITRVLVFTRTKHGANRLAKQLVGARIGADAIHGDKAQGARERALAGFKNGTTRVLVATDIAARGIDVDEVSHVINFDLPDTPESYVHRIGRTARAGASGIALSFCSSEEQDSLRDIERTTRQQLVRIEDHAFQPAPGAARAAQQQQQQKRGPNQRQGRGGGGGGNGGGGNRRGRGRPGRQESGSSAAAPRGPHAEAAPKPPERRYVPKWF